MIDLDAKMRARARRRRIACARRRRIELWTELGWHFAAGFALSALSYAWGWYRGRSDGHSEP